MKIRTWCDSGANDHSKNEVVIDTEDLGYSDEEWRLLGDSDKREAIEEFWFDTDLTMGHEVIE